MKNCFWKHDYKPNGWKEYGWHTKWFKKCIKCGLEKSKFNVNDHEDAGIGQKLLFIIGFFALIISLSLLTNQP